MAFTLLQLIGVLSVIAILVSVIVPVAAKRIDEAGRDGEAASLASMSEALEQSILANRTIPTTANFATTIAGYLNLPVNTVSTNKRGLGRVFMADPAMTIGLPYTQGVAGASTLPTGARLMIVSTIAKALPASMTNFNNIWTTAKDSVPGSFTNWSGRGEDLIVERIELGPRFHKILLMNAQVAPSVGFYGIDNATNSVGPVSPFSAYYMEGTVLTMFQADGTTVAFRETVTEDVSFVYQNGKWGRNLSSSDDNSGTFGQLVDRFLQQPVPCDPGAGATQRAVVNAFYDYLWGYADWAFGDPTATPAIPPFAGAGGSGTPNYPSYSVVNNAQTHMSGSTASFTKNLIE
jgi:type II secretory pathway pseudopilin PulG